MAHPQIDLIVRNVRLADRPSDQVFDIGIGAGRILAVEPGLSADCEEIDFGGRLVVPGFVETHIHLDKACILDRCRSEEGTLQEALREVTAAKKGFTVEDIRRRAIRTLDKCISHGTTRIRAHLEVDPVIGMMSIDAVLPLIAEYAWALDLEICVFPQEGLTNNPGTEELMIAALEKGARVIGGCPYTDSDPMGQIDRVFEIAQRFDVDIDFHLDFDIDPHGLTVWKVCDNTERYGWGGRVTIGHVSKLSALSKEDLALVSARMADTGVAITVLPSTDLFLMGGDAECNIPRGVAPIHHMRAHGVLCALSTNNVLNPFTPFGDGSLLRMANLYANIARLGTTADHRACLAHVTEDAARLLRLDRYGIRVGSPADLVILDAYSAEDAVREIAPALAGFKNGRRTFTRAPVQLHAPGPIPF